MLISEIEIMTEDATNAADFKTEQVAEVATPAELTE